MATYTAACSQVGSFSYAKNFTLYVVLTDRDGNSNTNKSQVDYNVYCQSSGSGSLAANHQLYFKLNGITIRNENVYVNVKSPNAYIGIASGTMEITHDNNGSKSITFEASISATGGYGVSASTSGTFTLTTIPRYASFTNHSVTGKTSSSVTISWDASESCDDSATQYQLNGGAWQTGGNWPSYTISGLNPNTTYTIKTRIKARASGLWTESSALTVTTYAKTIPTISLSSKTINSITVTSSCNVAVSSTQYRIKTSSGSYGNYQTSATFSGLTPNTTYVIEVKKVGTDSGESGTATLTVTTYQVATISTSNFNLGDNFNINITNPSGQSIEFFMETLNGTTKDQTIRVENTSSGSRTITLNDNELDMIYKKINTGTSTKIRVGVRTIGTHYDWKDVTCTLTGNQKTGHIKLNDSWKRSKKWINVNGTWKQCVRWINVNGTWKRCI